MPLAHTYQKKLGFECHVAAFAATCHHRRGSAVAEHLLFCLYVFWKFVHKSPLRNTDSNVVMWFSPHHNITEGVPQSRLRGAEIHDRGNRPLNSNSVNSLTEGKQCLLFCLYMFWKLAYTLPKRNSDSNVTWRLSLPRVITDEVAQSS